MKRRKKRNRGLILTIAVAMTICYYLFLSGHYSIWRLFEVREENERTRTGIEDLKIRIERQKEKNELLINRDPFEMEKKARERGMAREGEIIYKYEVEKEN